MFTILAPLSVLGFILLVSGGGLRVVLPPRVLVVVEVTQGGAPGSPPLPLTLALNLNKQLQLREKLCLSFTSHHFLVYLHPVRPSRDALRGLQRPVRDGELPRGRQLVAVGRGVEVVRDAVGEGEGCDLHHVLHPLQDHAHGRGVGEEDLDAHNVLSALTMIKAYLPHVVFDPVRLSTVKL